MLEAATDLGEVGHHAARRVEAESRSPGQNETVDPLDGHFRLEQSRVAQRRRAAVHRDRRDRGFLEQDHGDA